MTFAADSASSASVERFLSREALARKPSPLKGLFIYLQRPGMISLGGGLPHPDTFPFNAMVCDLKAHVNVGLPEQTLYIPGSLQGGSSSSSAAASSAALSDIKSLSAETVTLAHALQYGGGFGFEPFLAWCRSHIAAVHRPPETAEWVVAATTGNTDAFDKALRMFFQPGDTVLMESWSYPTAIETIAPLQINMIPVAMDSEGMTASGVRDAYTRAREAGVRLPRVIYIVPSGQNPTGSTQSLQRKKELYTVAQELDLFILEDDPYYWLQLAPVGQPELSPGLRNLVPSYLSIDTDGRVLRMDTFSKYFAPGFRLGWVTGHPKIINRFKLMNEVTNQQPSGFSQGIVAQLLNNTWSAEQTHQYVVQLQQHYSYKRDCILRAAQTYLADFADWVVPTSGMFLWLRVRGEAFFTSSSSTAVAETLATGSKGAATVTTNGTTKDSGALLFDKLIAHNVLLVPGVQFSVVANNDPAFQAQLDGSSRNKSDAPEHVRYLRATYALASESQIDEAFRRIGEVLREIVAMDTA